MIIMTIELKFPPNVIETNLDVKGVKVQIKKIDDNSYQIWINDDACKYDLHNIPRDKYDYFNNNYIHHQYIGKHKDWEWWCNGLYVISHTGAFCNGDVISYKKMVVLIESIENGVNRLEEIYSTPEIIKVGKVTIEKRQIDKNTECLSVDGLVYAYQYPSEITSNGNTVYRVGNDEFTIYDINNDVVDIDYRCYFPIKDFKVSNEDADKIIRIITASEKKLEEYYKEKNKTDIPYPSQEPCSQIKVGDIVELAISCAYEKAKMEVICIDENYAWVKYVKNKYARYTFLIKELKKIQE